MAVNNPDDYTKGQLLSADDVNTIKNNGVVQADSLNDLDNAATSKYKVAYVNGAVYVANLGEWQPLASTPDLVEYEPMVGTVQMFYGTEQELDPGWYICNGANGTPDLRGRIPIGVSATDEADANGEAGPVEKGYENISLEMDVGSKDHTLTAAQSGLPAHKVTIDITPEGTVSDGTVSVTGTPSGSVVGGSVSIAYTPAGTVGEGSVTVSGTTKGSVKATSASVSANYHNHYQWRTQKTAANGTGKTFYSFNGGASSSVKANNSIYKTDGSKWVISGSTGTPTFTGASMSSTGSATGMTFSGTAATLTDNVTGAKFVGDELTLSGSATGINFTGTSTSDTASIAEQNASESFLLAQPAVGLHFIMYKGVTTP